MLSYTGLTTSDLDWAAAMGRQALRLNPSAPSYYFMYSGQAEYLRGAYREAITLLRKGPQDAAWPLFYLAMAHAQAGEPQEAQELVQRLRTDFRTLRSMAISVIGRSPIHPRSPPFGRARRRRACCLRPRSSCIASGTPPFLRTLLGSRTRRGRFQSVGVGSSSSRSSPVTPPTPAWLRMVSAATSGWSLK